MIGLLTVISNKASYRDDVSPLALLSSLVELGMAGLLLSDCLSLITVPTNSFLRNLTNELCLSNHFIKVTFFGLKKFRNTSISGRIGVTQLRDFLRIAFLCW
jgi:hypothetical protein